MNDLNSVSMEELTEKEMVNIDGGLFNTPGVITGLEASLLVAAGGAAASANLAIWFATGKIPDPLIGPPAVAGLFMAFYNA